MPEPLPPQPDIEFDGELMNTLGALEKFLQEGKDSVPLLIRCGLAHAQFETIQPSLDGKA